MKILPGHNQLMLTQILFETKFLIILTNLRYVPDRYTIIKDRMQQLRNVVVTGSNKGIGFALVEKIAARGGWHIIMAVRNPALGEESRNQILQKFPQAQVSLEQLDISDSKSIDAFVPRVQEKYKHIDVLINNAGVAAKGDAFDSDVFNMTFRTNVYGTIEITEKALPLIADQGKIITLGSLMGPVSFKRLTNDKLKERFSSPQLTKEQLLELVKEFEEGVATNTFAEKGWPKTIYGVSKLSINTFARLFGAREDVLKRGIQVYACCPGYIQTDMTSHNANARPLEEGTITPLHLFDLPFEVNKELQGQFFQNAKLSSTYA